MDSFVANLPWPAAATVVAIVALCMFRKEIAGFLQRSSKVSLPGGAAIEAPQTPPRDTTEEAVERKREHIENANQGVGNVIVVAEGYASKVYENASRDFPDFEHRVRFLCNLVALENRDKWFEIIYRTILGSQLLLLEHLNTGAVASIADTRIRYEATRSSFGLDQYEFDGWFGYLKNFDLVVVQNDRVQINQIGRDFLLYLVRSGYTRQKSH